MANVYEPLPGKRTALSKLLAQVCRHRSSLTVYLTMELDLLPCGRKRAGRIPGSIAIIGRRYASIAFKLLATVTYIRARSCGNNNLCIGGQCAVYYTSTLKLLTTTIALLAQSTQLNTFFHISFLSGNRTLDHIYFKFL